MLALIGSSEPTQGLLTVMSRLATRFGIASEAPLDVVMAAGYGPRVNELDVATEAGVAATTHGELHGLVHEGSQWFDDLRVVDRDSRFAFGLLDSGTVFVEASQPDVEFVILGLSEVIVQERSFLLG